MDSAEAGWGSSEGLAQSRCHIEYYPHEYPLHCLSKGHKKKSGVFLLCSDCISGLLRAQRADDSFKSSGLFIAARQTQIKTTRFTSQQLHSLTHV